MKIRNLQEYIKKITQKNPNELELGSQNDFWLIELNGRTEDIKKYIGTISLFATDTTTQIFYEFLQNADDSGAKEFFLFFDEDNLLAINTGNPFYTDQKENHKGQLRGFLSSKKGDKNKEDNFIGKHGQGSKLLYDFFLNRNLKTEASDNTKKENQIIEAIIDQYKGPIIFSWKGVTKIDDLFEDNNLEYTDFDDIDNVLLTKIIYTYYPAMVKERKYIYSKQEEKDLFSEEEYNKFVSFFKDVIKKYSVDKSILLQGTGIYIALGEGQGKALTDEITKKKIFNDMELSLCLLKNVISIQINENKINKNNFLKNYNIKELNAYNDSEKGEKFRFIYPNEPNILKKETSNFFQYFPIQKEIYNLKYVIDATSYTITQDRQNIDINDEHNKKCLQIISDQIIRYLGDLVNQNNKSEYKKLFLCILFSEQPQNDFYNENFYTKFKDFILKNIPVSRGFAKDCKNVLIKKTKLEIIPSIIGIEDKDWLDKDLMDYEDKIAEICKIEYCNILELFNLGQSPKITYFVKKLSNEDYKLLLDEITNNTKNALEISHIPFVKFLDNNIYSIDDILKQNSNLLITTNKTKNIQKILNERSDAVISENIITSNNSIFESIIAQFNDDEFLFKKINNILNIDKLIRDDKWTIFENFIQHFDTTKIKDLLRNKLLLFQNNNREIKYLSFLIKDVDVYSKIGILNEFKILPEENNKFDILDEYFMESNKVWENFYQNWSNVKEILKKDKNTIKQLYVEINEIYGLSDKKAEYYPAKLEVIITKNNSFVKPSEIFYHEKISEIDYNNVENILRENTKYELIDFDYFEKLKDCKTIFSLKNQNLNDFFKRLNADSIKINIEQLKSLLSFKSIDESIFDSFLILEQQNDNSFLLQKKKTEQHQYYLKNEKLNNCLGEKQEKKYVLLPDSLFNLFETDKVLKKDGDSFIEELISKYGSEKLFIDVVEKQSKNIKERYFDKTETFELSSNGEKYQKDSYEVKFLTLCIDIQYQDKLKDKTKIDNKYFSQFNVKDEISLKIKKEIDKFDNLKFSLSKIFSDYKGVSDTIDKVKERFIGTKTSNFFDQKSLDLSKINGDLRTQKISNVYQLTYLVAYFCSEDSKTDTQKNISNYISRNDFDLREIIQSFFENKLVSYHTHYTIPQFIPANYIYASSQYIQESEKIPQKIEMWLRENQQDYDKKKTFLHEIGVKDDNFCAIIFRKNVIQNTSLTNNTSVIESLVDEKEYSERTFELLANKNINNINKTSEKYDLLSKFIDKFAEKYKEIRYCLVLESYEEEKLIVKYQRYEHKSNSLYFEKHDKNNLRHLYNAKQKLNKILIDSYYCTHLKEFLEKNQIKEGKISSSFLETKIKDVEEWKVSYYEKWKQDKDIKYQIFTSKTLIWFEYKINDELIEQKEDGKIGMSTDHKIYIHKESFENKSILDILDEYKDEYFKHNDEKNQLITLFKLANPTDEERELLDKIKKKGISNFTDLEKKYFPESLLVTPNIIQIPKNITEKQKENIEKIIVFLINQKQDILEKFLQMLSLLGNNIDNDMLKEIEEMLAAKVKIYPKGITGYVGEMLTKYWLEKYKAKNKIINLEYVADERPECDFTFKDEKDSIFEIDTKTTKTSVYEGTAIPFYIKISQYKYLQNKKPANYLILRIGLKDMGKELLEIHKKYDKPDWEDKKEKIDKDIKGFLDIEKNFIQFEQHKMLFRLNTENLDIFKFK